MRKVCVGPMVMRQANTAPCASRGLGHECLLSHECYPGAAVAVPLAVLAAAAAAAAAPAGAGAGSGAARLPVGRGLAANFSFLVRTAMRCAFLEKWRQGDRLCDWWSSTGWGATWSSSHRRRTDSD